MSEIRRPRVIVIGAGFAGMAAAQQLANAYVDVLLVDRNNYHLFTPLLYQVATCSLDASDIAYPIRTIFRHQSNLEFRLGEVTDIDMVHQTVIIRENESVHQESYDYLVLVAGRVSNFFDNESIEEHSFGMQTLSEALILRNHILRLFEEASWVQDEAERRALTTLVVVGGGPTGLETAGALYELYNYVLQTEYSKLENMEAHVILLEALDSLLLGYPEHLQESAKKQIESLGVEVMLNSKVDTVTENRVILADGRSIEARTLVWAAGVKASPLAQMLDVKLERGGRVPITPSGEVIGCPNVFAGGDLMYLVNPATDKPYPQLIPVATQMGDLIGKNIRNRIAGRELETFHYQDRGIMATIGRRRAVAWVFYRIQLTGRIAWFAWLTLHLLWLMGFRNRISVLINWIWNYFSYHQRGANSVRMILPELEHPHQKLLSQRRNEAESVAEYSPTSGSEEPERSRVE
jgi:NADH:ubiquinone reductase (H+-translocating)